MHIKSKPLKKLSTTHNTFRPNFYPQKPKSRDIARLIASN